MCRRRWSRRLTAIATALSAACGTDDIVGIDPVVDDDTTAPAVASTSPADGAVTVAVSTTIAATFSEAMSGTSLSASTFTLTGGVTGSVAYSGMTATLDPAVDLEYSTTYTATVSGSVTDVAGNALGTAVSWSFTTEAAPAPPFSIPFAAGKRWLYDVAWGRTVVGSSIGVRNTTYEGQSVVHVDGETQWQGRDAWRVFRYDLENDPGENPFTREVVYLSQEADGLHKWVPSGSGGSWRRVVSTQDGSFQDNDFFMAGDPRGSTTTISAAQVTVPAGTFSTLRARVDFTQTGQYVPEDIFEDRNEYYADGVGLVRADWDFDFDDNDPSAFDVFESGVIELTHVDTGPFPHLAVDAEPNDLATASGAQAVEEHSIVSGSVAITDPGTIVNGPNVLPNIAGQPLFQDWYRFTASAGALRIDMSYESYTVDAFNDLDVYLFREEPNGTLTLMGSGTSPEAQNEVIDADFLGAATYYVAIQAWDTPNGAVGYSFVIR